MVVIFFRASFRYLDESAHILSERIPRVNNSLLNFGKEGNPLGWGSSLTAQVFLNPKIELLLPKVSTRSLTELL